MFSAGDGNCQSIAMGRGACCLAVSSRPLGQRQRRPDGRTCSCCSWYYSASDCCKSVWCWAISAFTWAQC